jgi:bifunctional non-homologous end joining protein LigD
LPHRVEAQLATLSKRPPNDSDWIHEIKFDGYRMACRIEKGNVSIVSRRNLDWTQRFPDLARDLAALRVKSAWLDGEIVSLRSDGVSDFEALQGSFRNRRTSQLMYAVFDLLYVDGFDLRECPLIERKQLLETLLQTPPARLQYVEHIEGRGAEFFEQCCRMGLEGVISKRAGRSHRPGRSGDWIKVKRKQRADFVIVGFLRPESRRNGLRALLLGTYGADGTLAYAGRVGTGFSVSVETDLLAKLERLTKNNAPVGKAPREGGQMHWVQPELVADVEFTERTNDGELRHASFKGLRDEVAPASIIRGVRLGNRTNRVNRPVGRSLKRLIPLERARRRDHAATSASQNFVGLFDK